MKPKQKFVHWLIFIWLTILTISLIIRVEPNIVWSGDTFIGVFVAAIGVSVAFIIGHQIYNALDVKNDIRSLKADNQNFTDGIKTSVANIETENRKFQQKIDDEISTLTQAVNSSESRINVINASVKEGIAVLDALRIADDRGNLSNYLNAFMKMQEALLNGLDYDSNNYRFILDSMRDFAKRICTQSFGGGFALNKDGFYYCSPNSTYFGRPLKEVIDTDILPPIKDVESKIKAHPKFSCISHDYTVLMGKFYNRVEESSSRFFPKTLEEFENF